MLIKVLQLLCIPLQTGYRLDLRSENKYFSFFFPFVNIIQRLVIDFCTLFEYFDQFRIFLSVSEFKQTVLFSAGMFPIAFISGQNDYISLMSCLQGMDDGDGIGHSTIHIRNAVHKYCFRRQRHTARRSADIHHPFCTGVFAQIFRFSCNAVGHHHLALHVRIQESIKIKRKDFIRIFFKNQIHIQQCSRLQCIFYCYITLLLIRNNGTVLCTQWLP